MAHWLAAVEKVLTADTGDLKELARFAGYDPRTFYVGQDLSHCDLSGQDLTGLDLRDTRIRAQSMDETTVIDPFFDPRARLPSHNRYIEIPLVIISIITRYKMSRGINLTGSALKDVLDIGYIELTTQDETMWRDLVYEYADFFESLYRTPAGKRKRFTLKIKDAVYHTFLRLGAGFRGRSPGVIIGLVLGLRRERLLTFHEQHVLGRGIYPVYRQDVTEWEGEIHQWSIQSATNLTETSQAELDFLDTSGSRSSDQLRGHRT